ncbi:MAG TPA: aspartate-semialdehyde dehydrogenase [bacterium]|nr:aspartate-semialdehyde dehydrogenase [bacterium]
MPKKYNVCVVGAGLVGKKMVEILFERNFPINNLEIFATKQRHETICNKNFLVKATDDSSFNGMDFAFFAGTEGEKGASQAFGWKAVEKGAIVIDNGADFRMHPNVPLVIPEINPHHLKKHRGFIANPNCSTIIMLMAIGPLHKKYKVKNIIVSTYQAVSGTGNKAIEELETQIHQYINNQPITNQVYPHRILFNVIPHIGNLSDEFAGYYSEEVKMIVETKKILDEPEIQISATCARVPVINGHSESITACFELDPDINICKEILSSSPGVSVLDKPQEAVYPLAVDVSGKDDIHVGRIRKNTALKNAIDMWVVGDNIKKGAALNAVQIAEKLIEMSLI